MFLLSTKCLQKITSTSGDKVITSLLFPGAVAKLQQAEYCLLHVCPHWTTRIPLGGFSWNLTSEDFSKTYWENSSFIKIWQKWKSLQMKTCGHLSYYVCEFFLGEEKFQKKIVEKIKTNLLCSINFFLKVLSFMG
jgi:hypothetical protein